MTSPEEKKIIRQWGTAAEYYKYLEEFHEKHKSATFIEYDNEFKCPIRAVYVFEPLRVHVENESLKLLLAKSMEDENKP